MWIVIEGEKGGEILDEIGEERKGGRGAKRVRIGFIAMRPRCTVISACIERTYAMEFLYGSVGWR